MHTTVGALLDGAPIAVPAVRTRTVALPAGRQELLISPGAAFIVDGARLTGPMGADLPSAATHSGIHRRLDAGSPGDSGCRRRPVARVHRRPRKHQPGLDRDDGERDQR